MGDVRNLLAGRIISAVMFFFLPETSLTPAIFVSNRHFRKKCASGKPSFQTSGDGLNTVSFLFGSYASYINVIYLFIYNHWFQIFKFFKTYYILKQMEVVHKLLKQLLTIKLILLLIGCSDISAHASNVLVGLIVDFDTCAEARYALNRAVSISSS